MDSVTFPPTSYKKPEVQESMGSGWNLKMNLCHCPARLGFLGRK